MKRLAHNRYEVRSQSKESAVYVVRFNGRGESCEYPDHQYQKTVCKHIVAFIQRNFDMCDKAGANAPDAGPAPDPETAQPEPVLAGAPAAGTDTAKGKGKTADGDDGVAVGKIAKEEAVARLTTNFPRMDILGMLGRHPKEPCSQ
ncbi:MAG: hypothetical protein J4G04_08435 [Nitrosopumilaceae archaeon]|nr:hypothetical protein [Nitrosopumilaceae archaeon]